MVATLMLPIQPLEPWSQDMLHGKHDVHRRTVKFCINRPRGCCNLWSSSEQHTCFVRF